VLVIGIDLAGKPENDTGFCVLESIAGRTKTATKILHGDDEILAAVEAAGGKEKVDVIAIDAPFSFPKEGYWRRSDRELMERGFKPLSPVFKGMQPLVKRAMNLVAFLRSKGYKVVETFPQAVAQILNMEKSAEANQDEYDALLCALAGKAWFEKKFEDFDGIIVPKA